MTDEQIEKALERKANGYASDVTNLDYGEVLAYINRLKAERDNLLRNLAERNEEIERTVRKETAKDILTAIAKNNKAMGVDDCFIIELAEEYGVEVGE